MGIGGLFVDVVPDISLMKCGTEVQTSRSRGAFQIQFG